MCDRHEARSQSRRIRLGKTDIVLGPGKAFGSGEHETTASCLEILRGLPGLEGSSVLDIGCGTGVLAIAALKLGARSAVALDIDPDAIKATRANAALNSVSDRMHPLVGTVEALGGRRFDLILANLYGDLVVSALEAMVSRLAPDGRLILSGIAPEYVFAVKRELGRSQLEIERTITLEEYTTMHVRARPAARDPSGGNDSECR